VQASISVMRGSILFVSMISETIIYKMLFYALLPIFKLYFFPSQNRSKFEHCIYLGVIDDHAISADLINRDFCLVLSVKAVLD